MTDQEFLAAWENTSEIDIEQLLDEHYFEHFNRWCWVEVADEASRILGLTMGVEVERNSPLDDLHKAACSAAHHGALKTVASALGVTHDALWEALEPWLQCQDNLPPPVGFDGLMKFCAEDKSELYEFIKRYRR